MTSGRPLDRTLLEQLEALARAAGREIESIRLRGCVAGSKPDGSPLTEADLAADAVIACGLAEILPGVPVISEETVEGCDPLARPEELFVLVDPLDGTREFVDGRPEFTVNIALVLGRVPVAGVVLAPVSGLAWAGLCTGPDAGGWRIDGPGAPWQPIHVRKSASPPVAAVSRSHADAVTAQWLADRGVSQTIPMGSSLKFCLLADGSADLYARFGPTMEWDIAAGHAVLVAAGGKMTTPDGSPVPYGRCSQGYRAGPFIARGNEAVLQSAQQH
jgi:3'(2'), 5'-bisphosphate nucleotidase